MASPNYCHSTRNLYLLPDLNQSPTEVPSPQSQEINILSDELLAEDEITPQILSPPDNPISIPKLTNTQRRAVLDYIMSKSKDGAMTKGLVNETALKFSVSTRTIWRIWRIGKECIENNVPIDVSAKLPMRVGRKRIHINLDQISQVELRRRTNIRSLATALNMSKSTVHRRIKQGAIRAHSNPLKPFLTDENKKTRLRYCISMIDQSTVNFQPSFVDMYDYVHIDEKWFYMTKVSEKYYLHPQEQDPMRTCKSKRFITKVMFLAAVARPRIASSNVSFDGKIGIFPFIYKEPARRNSKNRSAGTLETKAITNVTKDVIRTCLIEKVLPAIRGKWPEGCSRTIYIQQDNARPHINVNDVDFVEEATKDGFNIHLCFQPPNSPDFNVLDLGFFRAIQSLQHEQAPSTIDELVLAVEKSFNDLPPEDLNSVFLTFQTCMVEVMKVFGGINYKIPHMNKEKLSREGRLPITIDCDREILNGVVRFLEGE